MDDPNILIKLIKNILLKENKFLFFKKIKSKNAFNHDEIVVAIGMIINPIDLKKIILIKIFVETEIIEK